MDRTDSRPNIVRASQNQRRKDSDEEFDEIMDNINKPTEELPAWAEGSRKFLRQSSDSERSEAPRIVRSYPI